MRPIDFEVFSILSLVSFICSALAFVLMIALSGVATTRIHRLGYSASFGASVSISSSIGLQSDI